MFSPILHARVYLNLCPVSGLAQKALPPGLSHAKDLEVRLGDFAEGRAKYDVSMNDCLAAFVARLLKNASNLRSFKSVTSSNSGSPSCFDCY